MREAVHGVVALAHGADEAAEGVDLVVALEGTTILVDLRDGDLDGAVILGLDDAVGGAALAGDVTVGKPALAMSSLSLQVAISIISLVGSGDVLQVHDLATVVLHFDGFGGLCGRLRGVLCRLKRR